MSNDPFTFDMFGSSSLSSGIGFGARVYFFDNGHRDDRRFGYTPYLHRVFAQAFFSTKGLQFHWLDYDAPLINDSSWRLRAAVIVGRNTSQNYFGRGADSMKDLTFTGAGRSFARASDYNREIERLRRSWVSQVRVILEERRTLAEQMTAIRAAHASLLAQMEEMRRRYAELVDQIGGPPAAGPLRDADRAVEAPREPEPQH